MPGWTGPPHRSKRWHRKWLQHPLLNRQKAAVPKDSGLQCQRPVPPGDLAAGPCRSGLPHTAGQEDALSDTLPVRHPAGTSTYRPDNVTCKDNLWRTRS